MDLTAPATTASELAAAFLQLAITVGLAVVCGLLYRQYRKPYFGLWALAWLVYGIRLVAIITFLVTSGRHWLYWHQVSTGWTALAILWAALVFSQQVRWRQRYLGVVLFPPLWSYVAIYQLDNFLLAAGPSVLFLSLATLWTAVVLFRYHRRVGSAAAAAMSVALVLWAVHHLDYPFLRARGAWNPWGYYLDVLFELAIGAGILLLVVEDTGRGLGTLFDLSGRLQRYGQSDTIDRLLKQLLALPAVEGSALYLIDGGSPRLAGGAGASAEWHDDPPAAVGRSVEQAVTTREPTVLRRGDQPDMDDWYAYTAVLPVIQADVVTGALLIVGSARDPFAALDHRFLVALGQQVGAALENAALYQRLEARTRDLERLASRTVQQHEDERRRLSRELHDETAQVFSAVKLQLGIAREEVEPSVAPRLDRAMTLVDTGIESIRNVAKYLRPPVLDDLGLVPALHALRGDLSGRTNLDVRLEVAPGLPALSRDAELALYRTFQEGLSNVMRHANAGSVVAMLRSRDGHVELAMRDDGHGMPEETDLRSLERNGHLGLAGIRERITALGGTLTVQSRTGRGTELVARVPVGS